ncbi:hypothetical protein ACQPWW_03615 [Micromonospora sp. CA-240977]|uniref:hypothetical protein n=1 Tax=Micromonospora sp. CA-240977 TaxID=3239957 RepID=UPI003D8F8493
MSFRHPLLRTACMAAATPADIARVHHGLAAATADPYRRARHLAAATPSPDASVPAILEAAADGALGRGDHLAGRVALRSAAEHSATTDDAARRYAQASFAAHRSGQPQVADELAEKVTAMTADPDLTGIAACSTGFALLHPARPEQAFELTARAARRRPRDGQVTLTAVVVAAAATLLSGSGAHRKQLPGLLDLVGQSAAGELEASMFPYPQTALARAAVSTINDPAGSTGLCPEWASTAAAGPTRMLFTGTIAFLRDKSTKAAVDLGATCDGGAPGSALAFYPLMVLALIGSGRLAEADRMLDRGTLPPVIADRRIAPVPDLCGARCREPASVAGAVGHVAVTRAVD